MPDTDAPHHPPEPTARTPEEILVYCDELPRSGNFSIVSYDARVSHAVIADWVIKARIDLPAMAQRVIDLEQQLQEAHDNYYRFLRQIPGDD